LAKENVTINMKAKYGLPYNYFKSLQIRLHWIGMATPEHRLDPYEAIYARISRRASIGHS